MNKIRTTFATFKKNTGYDGDPEKRGPTIQDVDKEFKNYDDLFELVNDVAQAALTWRLYGACKKWLYDKQNKPGTSNRRNRRTWVGIVAQQCIETLQEAGLISGVRAKFDTRKISTLGRGDSRPRPLVLRGLYAHERQTWIDSSKTTALSASLVHQFLKDYEKLTEKEIDKVSLNKYKQSANEWLRQYGPNQVAYVRKNKAKDNTGKVIDGIRFDYMVDIKDGLLCEAKTGTRLNVKASFPWKELQQKWGTMQLELHAYAMDQYGNLFMGSPKYADYKQKYGIKSIGSFNHSTFNAGKQVICAGCIGIDQGELVWIDNNSGHYKPQKENLITAVGLLAEDLVYFDRAKVGVYEFDDRNNRTLNVFKGLDFVHRRNSATAIWSA